MIQRWYTSIQIVHGLQLFTCRPCRRGRRGGIERVLATHKVLNIEKSWGEQGATSFWSFVTTTWRATSHLRSVPFNFMLFVVAIRHSFAERH